VFVFLVVTNRVVLLEVSNLTSLALKEILKTGHLCGDNIAEDSNARFVGKTASHRTCHAAPLTKNPEEEKIRQYAAKREKIPSPA
jgi:hypothetical protein